MLKSFIKRMKQMSATMKANSEWTNRLLAGTQSLGNTGESILDKVSDLISDYCKTSKDYQEIADRSGLTVSTIKRLKEKLPTEEGHEYMPFGDTLSRVLLVFGATITWGQTKIKPQFMPKEKEY